MSKNIDLRESVEYKEYGFQIVKCPICGNDTLDNFFVCPHCGWEYDGKIHDNDYSSINKMTIEEYRNSFNVQS